MKKVPKKLRIFRAKSGIKNPQISIETGACLQSVVNWASDERCPKIIEMHHAIALVKLTNGYITLKDCGQNESNQ